jgi:GNAT superfamily N-acetyltransferase
MRILTRDGPSGVDDAFVELPAIVYRDDPDWIPEEASGVQRAFSTENDWFATGDAVTLCVPGVARLAVFRAHECCVDGHPAAFFGYWEEVGAPDAGGELFEAAKTWARAHGAERLYGPINFTTHGAYRLRLEAEPGARPFIGEPYNPTSYPARLESLGFAVARRYITQLNTAPLSAERIDLARRALVGAGYTLSPLDGNRWRSLLPEIKPLTDAIFAQNFAFTHVSYESFAKGYGESVARRLCPRTSRLAYGPGGDLAGFALVYPDYAPLANQSEGARRVPASELSFAEHALELERRGERTGIVRTIGVAPAHRGRGLSHALGAAVVSAGSAHYDRWMAALIREDNVSRRFGDTQPTVVRRYGLYVTDVTGGLR